MNVSTFMANLVFQSFFSYVKRLSLPGERNIIDVEPVHCKHNVKTCSNFVSIAHGLHVRANTGYNYIDPPKGTDLLY